MSEILVALAGNPNVGKSTVFNALTGLNQHTGNWPGKTVGSAQGRFSTAAHDYVLADIPGTYSLMPHSAEEIAARDFLCFGGAKALIVVCDGTSLERNLNLVLQAMELRIPTVVCVNLMDEAAKKHISLDLPLLSQRLGIPVVGTAARKKRSLKALTDALDRICEEETPQSGYVVRYSPVLEGAIALLEPEVANISGRFDSRWLSLRLLEGDSELLCQIRTHLAPGALESESLQRSLDAARTYLMEERISTREDLEDAMATALVNAAEALCRGVVHTPANSDCLDRKLDKVLTSRLTGYPVMLCLLALIFYITIAGANYPSSLLSAALFRVQDWLTALFTGWGAPDWLHSLLVLGVYRVLAWVISVMLPPMAIFFPLFTLLEDSGYLPRVAYNLDGVFQRCSACGKQALTMCMGFGCNAAGVVGCRIIDSPRERLLAILTNNFVPCNGRFPALIAILAMFFAVGGPFAGVFSALLLTATILLGVGTTFAVTKLLSRTILKGVPSSFTLELPPYRAPQVGKVIVRSVLDRTLFLLGRAAAVAAPAGALIWILANVQIGGISILGRCAAFLDPLGKLMGMDGEILTAFLLGFPANEIVIPILLMSYLGQGTLPPPTNLSEMHALLTAKGWTWVTAVCVMLFFLNHWPCSTTLLTIRKETKSLKWTILAAVIPTAVGMLLCIAVSTITKIFCIILQ